jgi:putative SOS response-associated peptidase YedK
MCNYFRHKKYGLRDWTEDFSQIRIRLILPDPLPNLRDHERPTDPAPIIRPLDPADLAAGMELAVVRWDLVPFFWTKPLKGKFLATNARSETVATTAAFKAAFARRRCLVPADAFYEWTGEKGEKQMWEITAARQPWFCFAGLWDRAQTPDGPVESCANLTTAAGPDMAALHNRQPVVLERDQWLTWLDLSADVAPLYRPGPAGTLSAAPA